jgi:ribonuclease BN (tRNA processing enzyme)
MRGEYLRRERRRMPRMLLSVWGVLAMALWTASGRAVSSSAGQAGPPTEPAQDRGMAVVFLGTGMPRPDPARQGPALAVVVNGTAYLVDAGTGVVRQAAAASQRGIEALTPNRLDIVFLTHLHSDHTLGLPDLLLTPWVMGRTSPLRVYGPEGTRAMVDNLERAYEEDIDLRIHGLEHQSSGGHQAAVHEVQPGVVYQDENVKVTAFRVEHGSWKEALGYRFDAGGKSIVISGDTRPTESVVEACNGCDVLIHEVYAGAGSPLGTGSSAYFRAFHTSAAELGGIAARAKPKLLVVTHDVPLGSANPLETMREIEQTFHGPVMMANDLDVIAP